ncbi:hypothetical protein WA577_007226, partial [Blastocystis sp. JDR]
SNPKVFAFDIECSKAPLKFPNAEVDAIYMISIMIDGRGILIINRDIVTKDINDFEYTPHPDYKGPFHVYNEPSEEALLKRFYRLIEVFHFLFRFPLGRKAQHFRQLQRRFLRLAVHPRPQSDLRHQHAGRDRHA